MKKRDVFWGLLFVVAAVLVIIDGIGYFPQIGFLKIALTVILAGIIIKSTMYLSFPGILFPMAFICIMYSEQWNIQALTPMPVLLTALLGSIGLSMIFKKNNLWLHHCWNHNHHHEEHFSEVINEPDGNVVSCSASFGSSMKYINTDNFEKGYIKCSFGAMKVYFDNAEIKSGNAEVYLDISFSGVELYIPKTWRVVLDVNTSLGGIDEKNRNHGSASPVLTIKGNISLSGVEIIYV